MKDKTVRFLLIALLLLLPLSVYAADYHPFPPPLYEQSEELPGWLLVTEPQIIGDAQFVADVRQVLDYLQASCPVSYMFVVDNIRTIQKSNRSFMVLPGREVHLVIHNTPYAAATLVHEATHAWLYRHKYEFKDYNAEAFCNTTQAMFLERAGELDYIEYLLVDSLKTRWWERHDF